MRDKQESKFERISSRWHAKKLGITSGRPKSISTVFKRHVIRAITSGRVEIAADPKKMIENDHGVTIYPQTIRNMLMESDLKAAAKIKKPLLTKCHIRLRLQFAKRYQHWTVDDWKRVVFSEETKISRLGSDEKQWI